MRRFIKILLSLLKIIRFRINANPISTYIGNGTKFVGKRSIILSERVSIMPHTMLVCHGNAHIFVGEGTEIGMFSRVASLGFIEFGKNIITGPNVFISDYNHKYEDVNKSIKEQGNSFISCDFGKANISIGDDCWLGTNVVIVGNVKIGRHCVIGANSVVTKDIPDYCLAIGAPCKIVKKYNFDSKTWEKVKLSK